MTIANFQVKLEAEYEDLQPFLDTLYSYRRMHGEGQFFLVWMEGRRCEDEAAARVDTARRQLRAYWKKVKQSYEMGTLPLPRAEFLSGNMVCLASCFCLLHHARLSSSASDASSPSHLQMAG